MTVTIEAFEVWKRPYELATDDPYEALRLFFAGKGQPVNCAAEYVGPADQGIMAADLLAEYPDAFQQVLANGIVDEPTDELPGVAAITPGPVPASPDTPVVVADWHSDTIAVRLEQTAPTETVVVVRATPQLSLVYAADDRRLVGFVLLGVTALTAKGQP